MKSLNFDDIRLVVNRFVWYLVVNEAQACESVPATLFNLTLNKSEEFPDEVQMKGNKGIIVSLLKILSAPRTVPDS
jgi:hypothetical protein